MARRSGRWWVHTTRAVRVRASVTTARVDDDDDDERGVDGCRARTAAPTADAGATTPKSIISSRARHRVRFRTDWYYNLCQCAARTRGRIGARSIICVPRDERDDLRTRAS